MPGPVQSKSRRMSFYLRSEELAETAAALPDADLRDRVAKRRAERAHFWKIGAPPSLGTKVKEEKKEGEKEKKGREAEPEQADEPGLLKGNSGSPGKARGPARVICSIEEGNRLRPGDVLVAETTAPSWTPLFVTAAAVVTETGGILSHCAVVAREYRIPAVVGVDGAVFQRSRKARFGRWTAMREGCELWRGTEG